MSKSKKIRLLLFGILATSYMILGAASQVTPPILPPWGFLVGVALMALMFALAWSINP